MASNSGVTIGKAVYVPETEFDTAPGQMGLCAGCGHFRYLLFDLGWTTIIGFLDLGRHESAHACSIECAEAKAAAIIAEGRCV